MIFFGKFFSKHKYWELELRREREYWQWLEINFSITRKTDHAGISFSLEILGLEVSLKIYDHRHWNHEKDCWESYVCDSQKEEIL